MDSVVVGDKDYRMSIGQQEQNKEIAEYIKSKMKEGLGPRKKGRGRRECVFVLI